MWSAWTAIGRARPSPDKPRVRDAWTSDETWINLGLHVCTLGAAFCWSVDVPALLTGTLVQGAQSPQDNTKAQCIVK